MVTSDPSAIVNAVICAVIVGALMFYRRDGSRHRPMISLMAYFTVLVYASIPFPFPVWLVRVIPLAGGTGKHSYLRRGSLVQGEYSTSG